MEKEQQHPREVVKIYRILIITWTIMAWRETILYEMNDLELQWDLFFLAVCCRTDAVMGNESLEQNNLFSKVKTSAGTSEISPHLPARWVKSSLYAACFCLFACFVVQMQSFDSVY